MFAKTARPSSIAATMLAKLSSSSTMSAASRATSVPLRPIAIPTSALRKCRCVVDAVAGHRDDLTLVLQRADDAHLLLREHPREDDLRRVERELKLDVGEMPELLAGDHDGRGERTSPISRAIAVAVCG